MSRVMMMISIGLSTGFYSDDDDFHGISIEMMMLSIGCP